jgi:hypothetical protein
MDSSSHSTVSRRNVLKAAAAGAVVGIPAVVFMANNIGDDSSSGAATASTSYGASGGKLESKQPVVAYVRDASKGEVVVMSGMSEFVITDKKLVAQLLGVVEG